MKNILKILSLLVVLFCSGCMNLPSTVREMAKDPAAVSLEVRSIYFTVILRRAGGTNTVDVSDTGAISRK